MGNCTFTADDSVPLIIGNRKMRTGTITMSATYATNGDALNWSNESGIANVKRVIINPAGGVLLYPDLTNNKVKAYYDNAVAAAAELGEATNGDDLSAVVAPCIIIGW